jgi:hypothetical protein
METESGEKLVDEALPRINLPKGELLVHADFHPQAPFASLAACPPMVDLDTALALYNYTRRRSSAEDGKYVGNENSGEA